MKGEITQIIKGQDYKDKILRGVNLIGDVVGSTIGPFGRNVLIERRIHLVPIVTNDGKRVAKALNPKDPVERMAVRAICEAAENTDRQAGDGTTGTIVLAQAIINEAFGRLYEGQLEGSKVKLSGRERVNVVELRNQINETKDRVLRELNKKKKKITSLEELTKSAIISAESEELGKMIADMTYKTGVNGHIYAEESFTGETETEIIQGARIDGAKLAHKFMMLDAGRQESTILNAPILVTNHTIKNFEQFAYNDQGNWFGNDLMVQGKNAVVIMAWKFEKEFLQQTARIWQDREITQGNQRKLLKGFKIFCVKLPSILTEQLKDISIYVNAKMFDEGANMKLSEVRVEDLGKADKLTVDAEETLIVGGAGRKDVIENRIKEVKEQLRNEKIPEFKKRYEQRIADLASGVGIIRIGFKSQLEQLYVFDKVQDAVFSTKQALKDGIVRGGGLALKEIAEKLPEGNILKGALSAPYERIQENAGGSLKIGPEIVDPYIVVKSQVENACSVAGTLITSSCGIFDEIDFTLEDFKEEIKKWADKVAKVENPVPEDPALDR